MSRIGLFAGVIVSLVSQAFCGWINRADEVTYEWLVDAGNQTGYTDHVRHFREIFSRVKVNTFLEFGIGFSTKYFLDSSSKVISVEFVTNGYGPEWMKQCLDLYRDIPNWIPITYFTGYQGNTSWAPYKYNGSEHVYEACSYQCSQHKDYSLISNFYMKELGAFIGDLVKCHQIECAFVDPGMYLRGDLVTLLFDQVPIIVAHDTHCRMLKYENDVYGYSRIVTPSQYEEIPINYGQGTTVWIKKGPAYEGLIQALKVYADSIQR